MMRHLPHCFHCFLLGCMAFSAVVAWGADSGPPLKFVRMDTSRLMGSPDPLPPLEIEKAFPGLSFQRPLQFTHAGDGTDRIFVVTQKGIIYVLPNRADVGPEQRKVFLDWSHIVRTDDNEEGMMGLAFHPKHRHNGLFYVYYTTRPLQSVVARFRVTKDDADRADPESFEKLLNFPQPYSNHNGGSLEFGPDGCLYIGLGDGGSGGDPQRHGQNLESILGKVLRIDVDGRDPGLQYAIPKDNPFADRGPRVRREIWAYGVRNIWRLSFDRLTGTLWAGDVGQNLWEEIDIIVRGGNYGWNLREGMHPFRPELAKGDEKLIDPIWEYDRSLGKSITGGIVYRGKRLADLYGAYLYADYVSGYIWALRYDGQKVTQNTLSVKSRLPVSSFGQDEAGEAYFTAFDGNIYKFRPARKKTADEPPFPRKLSTTGLFESTKDLKPHSGLIPYTVNVPLWSDHAPKDRYLALPKQGGVGFHETQSWEFPVGTVLVKTFLMDLCRGEPVSRRRLETRLMVLSDRGWDGYTYLWNDEQTDAELLDVALTRPYHIATSDGMVVQPWYFPSRADCMACHTQAAGFALGLNTRQMNRHQQYPGGRANQLAALDKAGIFTKKPPQADKLETYPDWYASPDDPARVATLARAYLEVNCAICHAPGGSSNTTVDLRFHTPLERMGLVNVPPLKGRLGAEASRLITAGRPDLSELYLRMKTRGEGKMPNLATAVVDTEALAVIEAWIKGLKVVR